jgi:hypothetical protein
MAIRIRKITTWAAVEMASHGARLNMRESHTWDYLTKDPATDAGAKHTLGTFYYTLGWYLSLGLILNFGDQHEENVIVHKRRPCLIDLEITFKHRANDIEATMINSHFKTGSHENNVLMCLKDNVPTDTVGTEAEPHIKAGFADAVKFFKANKAAIGDWLAKVADIREGGSPRALPRAGVTGGLARENRGHSRGRPA